MDERDPSTRFRILSVDGGGMRGLVPALVLEDLEQRLERLARERRPLSDWFHLFAGTSTGGLIALALTAPGRSLSARDLVSLYLDKGESIFPTRFRFLRMLRGFVWPKFGNDGLEDAVWEQIGTARLSEALREVVITTYDMTDHRPRFLKRWTAGADEQHPDYPMAVAAMATASAPTYLRPWRTEDDHALVDGGVFAANPTIAAIAEALKRTDEPGKLAPKELFVVSLGPGFYRDVLRPAELHGWGALAWVRPRGSEPALMRAMLDGQTASADHWAHMILNHRPGAEAPRRREQIGRGPRYYRIESELATDEEMDDARRRTLDRLEAAARKLIAERGDDLEAIARALVDAGPIDPEPPRGQPPAR